VSYEFVTIELYDGCWHATLWDPELAVLAQGAGKSPQSALQNAVGVLGRRG
jgi:predicted RNase H-like HicB family nuclease